MKKITTERIVLDRDEREIRKTWGDDWKRIMADIRKFGRTCILTGTWSGYTSSQQRICNVEHVRSDHANKMVLRTVVFTDGTTLSIDIRSYTLEQIFAWKLTRRTMYTDLVRKARGTMQETYYVGRSEPEPQAVPAPVPVVEQQPEKTAADKIREEQEGNNWYDNF